MPTDQVTDIVVIKPNLKGRTLAMGDLHGSVEELQIAIKKLHVTQNDWLLFLGDVLDRGKGSAKILDLMMSGQYNFLAIRGNHEEMFLKYAYYKLHAPQSKDFSRFMENYEINGGSWVKDLTNDQLRLYSDFIRKNFPYLLCIESNKKDPSLAIDPNERAPFLAAHASIPISGKELTKRIAEKNLNLSEAEKQYITWARPDSNIPLSTEHRHSNSTTGILGHDIFGGIRRDTNELVLDFGTYDTGAICALDLSTRMADVIYTKELDFNNFSQCNTIKNHINYHLTCEKTAPAPQMDEAMNSITAPFVMNRFAKHAGLNQFAQQLAITAEDIYLANPKDFPTAYKSQHLSTLDVIGTNLLNLLEKVLTLKNHSLHQAVNKILEKNPTDTTELATAFTDLVDTLQRTYTAAKSAPSLKLSQNSLAPDLNKILQTNDFVNCNALCQDLLPERPVHK